MMKMHFHGKSCVGGNFTSYNGVTTDAAVRLKDNGQLD
jgi:hypothetical protein